MVGVDEIPNWGLFSAGELCSFQACIKVVKLRFFQKHLFSFLWIGWRVARSVVVDNKVSSVDSGDFWSYPHWHPNLTQIEPERCECISYCQRDFINIRSFSWKMGPLSISFWQQPWPCWVCVFFSSGMSPWVEESHKKGPWRTFGTNSFLANLRVTWNLSPGYSWILGIFFFMFSFLMIYF